MTNQLFGLHDMTNGCYANVPVGAVRLWDVGTQWRDIEKSQGVYDYTHMNVLVEAAVAHGAKVTYVLGQTPSFYAAEPTECPPYSAFENYVRDVMTEFKGRVDSYQVWNEITVKTFWTGTMQQMADLTEIVWKVRNEIDPDALVVAPSSPVRLHYELNNYTDYMSVVNTNYIDVYAFSLYPVPLAGPNALSSLVADIRRRLADYKQDTKPLWASEINYGVGSKTYVSGIANPIPESQQVSNVIITYVMAKHLLLQRCFWYRWDWGSVTSDGVTGTLGNTLLTDPTDKTTITAAGKAFHMVQDWLSGTEPTIMVLPNGTNIATIRGTETKRIIWNSISGGRQSFRSDYRTNQYGVKTKRKSNYIYVGRQPVLLT